MHVDVSVTLAAALAALAVSVVAWRLSALSASGAIAAATLGTLAMVAGWTWGVVLIGYFAASSALSHYRAAEKDVRAADRLEKTSRRDAVQVLANGGAFAAAALGFLLTGDATWQAAGAGALAASAADTWATEIGMLGRHAPRSIVTFRSVPPGTSGGVTALGLTGGMVGALFVMGLTLAVRWPARVATAALVGGLLGTLLDSLLGATLQCRRWCHTCHADTERVVHGCGTRTDIVGGLRWLDNDGVNTMATVAGAIVSAAIALA